jgi:hypothetical protein
MTVTYNSYVELNCIQLRFFLSPGFYVKFIAIIISELHVSSPPVPHWHTSCLNLSDAQHYNSTNIKDQVCKVLFSVIKAWTSNYCVAKSAGSEYADEVSK